MVWTLPGPILQYALPNNTVLLVSLHHFDPDPVIVNVNKLKPYRVLEESILGEIPSPHLNKSTIKSMTLTNEDDPTPAPPTLVSRLDWSTPSQTVLPIF